MQQSRRRNAAMPPADLTDPERHAYITANELAERDLAHEQGCKGWLTGCDDGNQPDGVT